MSLKRKRVNRNFNEKKEILDYYESIKHEFGAKTKTIKKFNLNHVSSLNTILAKKKKILMIQLITTPCAANGKELEKGNILS